MTFNFGELAAKMGQPLRVFGNLPYNISTPLMFHLFSYTDAIADMHFMLQRSGESSGCRTEQQGVWSIKRHGAILLQRDRCWSTAVSIHHRKGGFRRRAHGSSCNDASPVKDVRVLSRITTEAFNQRHVKLIRNSLGNLFSVEVLTGMGIDPAMRAENISVAQYCQMANYLAENALCRRVNDDQFAPVCIQVQSVYIEGTIFT